MNTLKEKIAMHLLNIGAVELKPDDPFTWTSGIQAPIYCDNRLTMSYPQVRQKIARGLVTHIEQHFSNVQIIAGAATGGIPHAAWVAEMMDLPMCYVRSGSKRHGKQNQVEGKVHPGDQVVVVEDTISTGGSAIQAAEGLQAMDADVLGVVSIFTYGFQRSEQAFHEARIPYFALTDYPTLIQVARKEGGLTEEELCKLEEWNPFS